jgi:hypothetical protein
MGRMLNTMAAGLLFLTGCDLETEPTSNTRHELWERSADTVEEEIRQISIYQRFEGGRYGVSYKTFTEISGIKRELSEDANDLGVWIQVIPKTRPYDLLRQEIVSESKDSKGHVRFDIPYEIALEVNSKLAKYSDEQLGIERLPKDFYKGIPPGDY